MELKSNNYKEMNIMNGLLKKAQIILYLHALSIIALDACPICHSKEGSVKNPYFHENNIGYHAATYRPSEMNQAVY